MLIANTIPDELGWSPIQHMVAIAGELLECQVMRVDRTKPSHLAKVLALLRQRSRPDSGEACLLVCTGPADLLTLLNIGDWRKRFRYLAAWVVDSFWLGHIPSSVRIANPFDHFFVTTLEDVDRWRDVTGVPTTWLPWGTDVLRLGSGRPDREWDLTRVGRQPPEWDDDSGSAAAAASLGIRYRGRPDRSGSDALLNQKFLMSAYSASKFILAFSNAVNCDPNNHPTREYVTGRWVDALGSGAIVAGVAPRSPSASSLFWEGATLELGGIQRSAGLEVLAEAVRQWTPERALTNYQMALRRLDWRWRLKTLAEVCEIRAAPLDRELQLLEERIAEPAPRAASFHEV